MNIIDTTLVVPAGDPSKPEIRIDLSQILIAEGRQGEVAMVTPMKAPELLAVFNSAWLAVNREVTQLVYQRDVAEKEVERRKATVLLEVVTDFLKEKGIASSTDTRKAVIDLDSEYIVRQDTYDQLSAAVEHLKGKQKSFENSFTSVKKIMGEDVYQMQNRGPNRDLSGDTRPNKPIQTPPTNKPVSAGWGKPRY